MSKPKNPWWPYALAMIRLYPEHEAELDSLRAQSVTANYSDAPKVRGDGRSLEHAAEKTLSNPDAQREYEAVAAAIRQTEAKPNGAQILQIVKLVHWQRSHTLAGAAMVANVAEITAKKYHAEFVRDVARAWGFTPR